MKPSFSSVLVLAALPCLVLGAPWRNRHVFYARGVEAKATTTAAYATASSKILTTTALAKAEETAAYANSTTIAEEKATATQDKAESTASTTIKGKSPLQTALLPSVTDWNSCQSFLSKSGINLFDNQRGSNVNVVINKVNIIEVLIDEKGRARETRVRHAFPQPTNYYPEFDQSKNKLGNNKGNKDNKGNKGNKGKPGVAKPTITTTAVTETASQAQETATANVKESATETLENAEETATTTAEEKAKETASETAKKAEESATATESASTTAAAEETKTVSKESAAAEATAYY